MRFRFLQQPDVAVALGSLHEMHRHYNNLGIGKVLVAHHRGLVALCIGCDAGRAKALELFSAVQQPANHNVNANGVTAGLVK